MIAPSTWRATSVAKLRNAARSPLAWILALTFLVRVVGLMWGLPASDGWDNDGIAPRDFLPGVIETYTPGHYFTYPPAQLALLTILTLPITIVMLIRAPSLSQNDVLHEALKIPYMTSYSIVARLTAVVMSIGIVYAAAKIAEEVAGRRGGLLAGAVCALNVILTYYAHTTNLDVPYLFWGMLALLALTHVIARHEPKKLRRFAIFAALAVATKDQAYALFVLAAPGALLLFLILDSWAREHWRPVMKEVMFAFVIASVILLFVDGAIVNPSGFRARIAFLAGPASQPFAYYSADAKGRAFAALDSIIRFDEYYPVAFAPFVLVGLGWVFSACKREKLAASLVPLLAAASFTAMFNCIARRTEHRFVLPQMTLWSIYAGLGFAALIGAKNSIVRWGARGVMAVSFAWALFRCIGVDANLYLDPRYDAEAWMAANIAPGDLVEVQGKNVYLPRFPAGMRVVRVGPDPVDTRNPLYGAEEKRDALLHIDERAPRFIVVSDSYAGHYLYDASKEKQTSGRVPAQTQRDNSSDADASTFFHALFERRLDYHVVHHSTYTSTFWPRLDIHGVVARDIWIFERDAR